MDPSAWKRPWAITLFGCIAILGLGLMPIIAGPPGKEMPDWVNFIGHFHPVVLHLPIGVFLLIIAQEMGAMLLRRWGVMREPGNFPLFFGAASSVVAVIAGFMLYQGGGEDYAGNEVAERHLWGGTIFAMAAIATFIVKCWTKPGGNSLWYRVLLFGSVGIMGLASHDGGTLTHGEGFLTKHAPPFLKKLMGEKVEPEGGKPSGNGPAAGADAAVFTNVIAPILERRCVSCHKEGKAKGKLRVDTYEALMKGGADGPSVDPGNSGASLLVERMELPLEDDERMPPKGKPQPEEAELRVLKWWIDAGASPDKTAAELNIPVALKADYDSLAAIPAGAGEGAGEGASAGAEEGGHGGEEPPAVKPPDDSLKASVASLAKEFPGAITFESTGNEAVAFTAVGLRAALDDSGFAKFEPVFPHLVSADLSATKITDASVEKLAPAKNLRMLRLAETAVTDAAIDSVVALPQLESLNLYGTKITDAGVAKLSALPGLKRLYLWQTEVTPAGVDALKQKLPQCEIVTGSQ